MATSQIIETTRRIGSRLTYPKLHLAMMSLNVLNFWLRMSLVFCPVLEDLLPCISFTWVSPFFFGPFFSRQLNGKLRQVGLFVFQAIKKQFHLSISVHFSSEEFWSA